MYMSFNPLFDILIIIFRFSLMKQPVRKDPVPVATRSKPLEFKEKTNPYFKDNVINPNEQDDFDPNMYYFKRDKEVGDITR
mgnify:CR=1 FL=1